MSNPSGWFPLPLVGRDAEVGAMRRALDVAAGGACACRIVAGGHGLGKTRLLQATIEEATSRGFTVARAVAYQMDANVPYAVLADALTPVVRNMAPEALRVLARGAEAELTQVVPAIAGARGSPLRAGNDADDLTTRVRWHVAQFVGRLSRQQPLLVAIDNVHWADPSSVALLHFVLRHAPEARLLVAAAYNHVEADATSPFRTIAKAMDSVRATEQFQLAPLTEAHLRELLARAFAVDDARLRHFAALLHHRTLGNPFFVEETIKTLLERGALRRDNGVWVGWDLEEIDLPPTIRESLLERVDALTSRARNVANIAAVCGARVSHDLLHEASGQSPEDFIAAVEELRARNVATDADEPPEILYDFSHPLLQRTIYEELGAAKRRELHGRVGLLLERQLGDNAESRAADLAHHFVRSGTSGLAPRSFRYLLRAGRDALSKHADREAARYLQLALDLADGGDAVEGAAAQVPGLVEDLARARQRLAEHQPSQTLWMRARAACASLDDEAGLARIERRLGLLAYWSGRVDVSITHYDAALDLARRSARRDIEVRALVSKAVALQTLGRHVEAKREAHAALAIAETTGDVGLRARVERALLVLYTYTGPVEAARDFGRRVIVDARAAGESSLAWSAHLNAAILAGLTADAATLMEHAHAAEAIAQELNSPVLGAQIAEVQIEFASANGAWAEGLALAERVIPAARALAPRSLLPRILVWTGTILLNRDDIERAKACFDEAWELSRAGSADASGADLSAVIVAHIGQAAFHLTTRDWMTAIDFAQGGLSIADRHGMVVWAIHRLLPILAESALWVGDFALAEATAARLHEEATRLGHPLGVLWADIVMQLVARWRDDTPGVIDRLLAAAEPLERIPFVFHAARLRRHIARLLETDGDREGAMRELRRAHDVFLRVGAALELRLTREQMRKLGIRPPQQSVIRGGVLTAREVEILRLVVRHQTNKEIARALGISARTVSTHLSNMFQKLGVDSRGLLADVARRDGLLGEALPQEHA